MERQQETSREHGQGTLKDCFRKSSVAGSESVEQTAPPVEEQMGLNGQETVDSGSGQDDSNRQDEGRTAAAGRMTATGRARAGQMGGMRPEVYSVLSCQEPCLGFVPLPALTASDAGASGTG